MNRAFRSEKERALSHQKPQNSESDQSAAPIGESIPDAVRDALDQQPAAVFRRVRSRLVQVCPDFAQDWACDSVAWLVAEGAIPEVALEKAVMAHVRRVWLGKSGELELILSEKGHLGVVLRRLVEQHGYQWRNYARNAPSERQRRGDDRGRARRA